MLTSIKPSPNTVSVVWRQSVQIMAYIAKNALIYTADAEYVDTDILAKCSPWPNTKILGWTFDSD